MSPGLFAVLRPEQRARSRGFTLIELLVAILAGALVTMAAFAFAKASTRSFQQESRIAGAGIAGTLGFRRLTADIQRAAYMSTPNIQREYQYARPNTVCMQPTSDAPAALKSLAGLRIEHPTASGISATNSLSPDRITIAGNFAGTEQYFVRRIAGATDIYLEPVSGAVARTAAQVTTGGQTWSRIFPTGRILRLVDRNGYQHFGIIDTVEVKPNPAGAGTDMPMIRLTSATALFIPGSDLAAKGHNPACTGIPGLGAGSLVNVVNRVVYEVRSLEGFGAKTYDSLYADIYTGVGTTKTDVTFDDKDHRLDLARYEIDASGEPISGTEELIAEYAVDMKFGVTYVDTIGTDTKPVLTLKRLEPGADDVYATWGRSADQSVTSPGPERIRAVRVRLSVRSREADRTNSIDPVTLPSGLSGGIYRYKLAENRYARVRSLSAEVSLDNQMGVFW